MMRCDRTAAWAQLQQYYAEHGAKLDLRAALRDDALRVTKLSQAAPYIFADLSKNHLDDNSQELLMQLARQCGVEQQRDTMLR